MANYHLDTEFSEDGPSLPITLVSVALVADDGRELYLVSGDALSGPLNPWVREHVVPNLGFNYTAVAGGPAHLGDLVARFVGDDPHPILWGYYSAHDWVVFCQLWTSMIGLPPHFPRLCRDLAQFAAALGADADRLAGPQPTRHNALEDARWIGRLRRALAVPDSPHARLSHFFRGEM